MDNQDVKQVSNVTGTFQALQSTADQVAPSGKVAPEAGKEPPVVEMQEPDIEALAAKLNTATQSIGRDLRFKVDMDSGRSVIQVLDRDTGELIREIPPEKAQFSVSNNGDVNIRLYDALA
ncbi:MAG: flagellar protein FlaG [Gammaproteobacteria bacterium]|nr:flagellar protein FlaG [Gammaproteobacteria bacterium]